MPLMYHPQLDRTVEVAEQQIAPMRQGGWEQVEESRGTFIDPLEEVQPHIEEPVPLAREQVEVTAFGDAEPSFVDGPLADYVEDDE
jgi:hypothetical protein